jgi:hypothetical protein
MQLGGEKVYGGGKQGENAPKEILSGTFKVFFIIGTNNKIEISL